MKNTNQYTADKKNSFNVIDVEVAGLMIYTGFSLAAFLSIFS